MDKSEMDTRRVVWIRQNDVMSDMMVLMWFEQSNGVLTIRMLDPQEVDNAFIL